MRKQDWRCWSTFQGGWIHSRRKWTMTNSWWFITVLLYWQYKRVIMRCTYRTKEVLKDKFKVM